MSPSSANGDEPEEMFYFAPFGLLGVDYIVNDFSVRPVINLKADVKFTGDGTIDNPYKIVTE